MAIICACLCGWWVYNGKMQDCVLATIYRNGKFSVEKMPADLLRLAHTRFAEHEEVCGLTLFSGGMVADFEVASV